MRDGVLTYGPRTITGGIVNIRRRYAFVLGLAICAGLASAPADAGPGGADTEARTSVPVGSAASEPPADQDSTRVQDYADRTGALGTYYDSVRQEFVVRIPSSGRGSTARLGRVTALDVPTRAEHSKFTHQTVDGIFKEIGHHADQAQGRKFVYGFAYDPTLDTVRLNTNAPLEAVRALLRKFPKTITYKYGRGGRDGRYNDTAPHYGAAVMVNEVDDYCTAGFTVKNSAGGRVITTAGHCYQMGDYLYPDYGGDPWGRVVGRAPYPARDLEFVGGSTYAPYIYIGGSTGAPAHVKGAGNPGVNGGYCRSGGTTYEKCGMTVWSLSAGFCDDDGCTYGLFVYNGPTSASGDSGSPIFLYTPTKIEVYIRGMHIGRIGSDMYAEKWSTVAAYGYSIVT